jgi:hypothetical protein
MGFRVKDIEVTTSYIEYTAQIQLTRGSLVTASIIPVISTFNVGLTTAKLLIYQTFIDDAHVVAILSSGYTSIYNPLGWHGAMPCNSDHYLACKLRSFSPSGFRLIGYVQDVETSKTGIPRDP